MPTRITCLALFASLILGTFAIEPVFGQEDAAAKRQAMLEARRAALQQQRQAERARQLRGQQRQQGPILDAKALDTTPTFESVQPKDASALVNMIDSGINARLKAEGVPASPICTDGEFIRRLYLDVLGKIPSPGQVRAFLDSRDPQKRAKLIDELLASEEYGKRQADIWTSLMVERFSDNRRLNFSALTEWLTERFNDNQPWDKLTYDLLTATGPQDENGAVTYYLANLTPDKITDSVCRVFLGVQLQCAQCHNHPFTDWKQDEYWQMAAFFMKVRLENNRAGALRDGQTPGISEVAVTPRRIRGLPESAKMLDAKFLQGEEPELGRTDPFRPVLADWMTKAENPFFAKSMVNRTWGQFFGRGFINPLDDIIPENPASHPELLDALSETFATDFDIQQLIRGICNSQTYQRSAKPVSGNENDEELFSHMALKVMSPEQLFDSMAQVLGQGAAAVQQRGGRNGGAPRDRFVEFYLAGGEYNPTEYEAGIPQALKLMNSNVTGRTNVAVRRFVKPNDRPEQAIESLYLATVSRRPTAEELAKLVPYVTDEADKANALGDILWALLNSSEFVLNH